MLSPGTHTLLEIVARTAVVYTLVLVGIRISGKREVGQMTPFDLTLLLRNRSWQALNHWEAFPAQLTYNPGRRLTPGLRSP